MLGLTRLHRPLINRGWSTEEREALVAALTRRKLITRAVAAGILAGLPASLRAQTPVSIDPDGTIDFTFLDLAFEVPANPQRVVVVEGRGDLEFCVIVGYPIVASGNTWWPDETPGARLDGAASADITLLTVNSGVEIDLEQLVSLQPDLIVMRANGYRSDWYGYDQLSAIAPVLAVEVNRPAWRQDLVDQAALLGRTDQIQPFLQAYDQRLASAKTEIGEHIEGKNVYFMAASAEPYPIWGQEFACSVATNLGMQVPLYTSGNDTQLIGSEQLNLMADADLIIRQINSPEATTDLDGLATWQSLKAVQAGHVYDLSPQFNNGLAIQARLLLDELVKAATLLKDE